MKYAAAVCCAVLAVYDAGSGRIPNKGILIFSLAGLVWSFVSGKGAGLLSSVIGAGGMFLLLWFLYSFRLMGAGDVKLFMMLGIYFGWPGVLYVFAASIAAGSIYALIRFFVRKDAKVRFLKLASYLDEVRSGGRPESYIAKAERDARVSFAVFAACGSAVCAILGIG